MGRIVPGSAMNEKTAAHTSAGRVEPASGSRNASSEPPGSNEKSSWSSRDTAGREKFRVGDGGACLQKPM